ncbi:acrosin-binding protein-like [Polyodon spathula]|uniref:acrosin-binding protein-like n=1 Tax=Polyodon spathula TaxID=7913 RepID=UPI001B7F6F05|nr:acrosin-binding protein-like [Polyodon spathula]
MSELWNGIICRGLCTIRLCALLVFVFPAALVMWRSVEGQDFENRRPGTVLSSSEYSTFFSALRPSWKASVTCQIRRSHGCNDPQLLRLDQFENHGVLPKGPICTDLPGSPRFSSFCQFAQFRCSNHLYYAMRVDCYSDTQPPYYPAESVMQDTVKQVESNMNPRVQDRPIYPESGPVYPEPPQNIRSLEPQYSGPPQTPLLAEPQNPRSWEPQYPNLAPPPNPPSGVSQKRLEPQMTRPPEGKEHHAQHPSEDLKDQDPGPTEITPLPASPHYPPPPPRYFLQEGSMLPDGKEDTLKGRLWGMSAAEMLHILCAELLFGSCLQSTMARVWMEHEDHKQSFGELVCDSLGRQHQDSCQLCAFCSLKMEQCRASGNVNRVKCADGLNYTSYLNPKIQAEHENIGNQVGTPTGNEFLGMELYGGMRFEYWCGRLASYGCDDQRVASWLLAEYMLFQAGEYPNKICDSDDFIHPHYCSFKSYQCRRYSAENILVARMTCENDKSYRVLNMERGEEEVLLWSQKFLSYTQG